MIRYILILLSCLYLVVGMMLLQLAETLIVAMTPTDWVLAVSGGTFILVAIFLTFIAGDIKK